MERETRKYAHRLIAQSAAYGYLIKQLKVTIKEFDELNKLLRKKKQVSPRGGAIIK